MYELGEKATNEFENARKKVAKFIGATSAESIIFTKRLLNQLILLLTHGDLKI
ncbi:MAG: hypothetical protein Ct9H90mP15_03520 [Candidatus Neomarinimicrobiota bacterium]|nr:MAG: hypothetical protein Ct9H90mP15_03520 [Candidatus Neomarinimicrobiota bacterium]